jgi:hypothetical protein
MNIPNTSGSHLIRQEEPEKTLWKRLLSTGSLRECLLTFGDGLATESDAFFRIENGTLPYETYT